MVVLGGGEALASQTAEVAGTGGARAAVGGDGTARRLAPTVGTLAEALEAGAAAGSEQRPCLGFRAAPGAALTWLTWADVKARINVIAHGLLRLSDGDKPAQTRVAVLAGHCPEASLLDQALHLHSRIPAHLHSHWSSETIVAALNQLGAKILCLDTKERLAAVLASVQPKCGSLRDLVLLRESGLPDELAKKAAAAGLNVRTLGQIEAEGKAPPHWKALPKPEDTAAIVFNRDPIQPKAVVVSHANVMSQLAGMGAVTGQAGLIFGTGETLYSGRSLAYIPQRVLESLVWIAGCRMIYGAPGETDLSVCATASPNIIHLMPKTLVSLRRQYQNAPGVEAALAAKEKDLAQHVVSTDGPHDAALAGVRGAVGGKAKLILVCNEPLDWATLRFLRLGVGVPVMEGLLSASASGVVSTTRPADLKACGHVGAPVAGLRVRLRALPELGLSGGSGELCVEGPAVSAGFLDQAKPADGWIPLGDVASWNPDGTLQLIGHKEELRRLPSGQILAPSKLEMACVRSPLVQQVMVVLETGGSRLGAFVVLAGGQTPSNDALLRDLNAQAQENDLPEALRLAAVASVPDFPRHSPEAPWHRLNRPFLIAHFADNIAALFKSKA